MAKRLTKKAIDSMFDAFAQLCSDYAGESSESIETGLIRAVGRNTTALLMLSEEDYEGEEAQKISEMAEKYRKK